MCYSQQKEGTSAKYSSANLRLAARPTNSPVRFLETPRAKSAANAARGQEKFIGFLQKADISEVHLTLCCVCLCACVCERVRECVCVFVCL